MDIRQDVLDTFHVQFQEAPTLLVRAPGRVNLIGEHTDYNDGFVMPLAIDRAIWIALRPRHDGIVRVTSLDFEAPITFSLENLTAHDDKTPSEYAKGIAWALQGEGYVLKGFEGVMKGDVPIGAGLSSSAAFELAIARAFCAVSGIDWEPKRMALLAQKTENQWIGVKTGIMDQMISATGIADHAILIDCRSLDLEPAPLPTEARVVVLDTGTRRGLLGTAYNERREQCETAAAHFGVAVLRDVDAETFEARSEELDEITRKRARHVITENMRTVAAKEAMHKGQIKRLGELMNASHVSLRDDFEVSSPALNAIVECAQSHPGCYGARMTGGGFGGCAVALVQIAHIEDFVEQVIACYIRRTNLQPNVYVCRATNGASLESLD